MNGSDDVEVAFPGPVGRHASRDVHFMNVRGERVENILRRHLVRVRFSLFYGEVTELAGENANIRMLDLLIENEVDGVAAFLLLDEVRHLPEGDEVVGIVEEKAI